MDSTTDFLMGGANPKQSEFMKVRQLRKKSPNRSSSKKRRQTQAFENFIHRAASAQKSKSPTSQQRRTLQPSSSVKNTRMSLGNGLLDVRMVAKEIEEEQQLILAKMQAKQHELNRRKQKRRQNSSFDAFKNNQSN